MSRTLCWIVTLLVSALLVAGCDRAPTGAEEDKRTPPPAAARDGVSLADTSDGKDWPAYGRTYGEQHFSPLDQVNTGNVGQLGLAWSFDLPPGNSVVQPLAVNGKLFISTGNSIVRSLDARTGKELWVHDTLANNVAGERMRLSWGSRGLGYWNGKVYAATVDGRLVALDAASGKPIWTAQTLPEGSLAYVTGAPRLFDGKVIIGQGGADGADLRGFVSAYDAETGKRLWKFYTVPGNPELGFEDDAQRMAARTWHGQWWKNGGGGNVWNAFTYDAETRTIILGTGNGSPWNRTIRSEGKGDNLFLCSIVALDGDTGRYKWHYQVNPGEQWDYNASMDMHLADLEIGGERRKVLVTAPKNGFLYVIDRRNGKLISASKIAKVTWAEKIDEKTGRPVETPIARYPGGMTAEIWPGPTGAHASLPSAFSPQTGLFYLSVIESGATYSDRGIDPLRWSRSTHLAFNAAVNLNVVTGARDEGSRLEAWDPVRRKRVWSVPTPGLWNGGVMATAGRLIFQGQPAGVFNAYDASSGRKLWSFPAQAGVLAPPISYTVDGKQYVTVMTGIGISAGTRAGSLAGAHDYRTQARRVLTFALGGKAQLPPSKPYRATAPADLGYKPDSAAAGRGASMFGRCAPCHGSGAVAAGTAPDLRESAIPQDAEAFDSVVRQGVMVPAGMPKFGEFTDAEMNDLRAYLRSRSADLRARRP